MQKVFISHSTKNKIQAINLSDALKEYNIDAFVAHEHIEVNAIWLEKIKEKLAETDVGIALITEDFNKSDFCQQEVGYILGKQAKLISIMLDNTIPQALIGDKQGIIDCLKDKTLARIDENECFTNILKQILSEEEYSKLKKECRITDILNNFASSKDFNDVYDSYGKLLSRLQSCSNPTSLYQREIDEIIKAFNNSGQVREVMFGKKYKGHIIQLLNFQYKNLNKNNTDNKYYFDRSSCTIKKNDL